MSKQKQKNLNQGSVRVGVRLKLTLDIIVTNKDGIKKKEYPTILNAVNNQFNVANEKNLTGTNYMVTVENYKLGKKVKSLKAFKSLSENNP